MAAEKELKQNGMLSLPTDWYLKSIAEVTSGWQYGLSDALSQKAKTPCLRMNNYRDGRITSGDLKYINLSEDDLAKYRVNKGDILFNRTNSQDLVGKVGIFDLEGDYVFASYLVRMVPELGEVRAEFLNAVLNTDWNQRRIRDLATPGVSQCNVNVPNLKRLAIPVPPLEVQDRIICVLRAVDEAIEATRAVIDQTRQLKTALLQDLLTNGLPGRHSNFICDTRYGRRPREWSLCPLADLVAKDRPVTYGIVQAGPHIADGIPYIRVSDMQGRELSSVGMLRTSNEIAESYRRSTVRDGDIVFALRGDIGAVHQVPPELDGANLTQGTARISVGDRINPRFTLWAMRTPAFVRVCEVTAKGSTFKEVSLRDLEQLCLPLPEPEEQTLIAEAFDSVESTLWREEDVLEQLRRQKAALSQGLLTGRIPVKGGA